jgi:uncharacterized protein DUF3667
MEDEAFTHCENCGTELRGHWCYKCSQAAVDYHRSFGHVIYEVLVEFWDWDSKIFGTLGLLIAKPWRLTIDFNGGKRVRHANPLRLYLLASILFFFAVNFSAKGLKFEPGKTKLNPKDRAELQAELDKEGDLPPAARAELERLLDQPPASPAPSAAPSTTASTTPSPTSAPTASPPEAEKQYGPAADRPFLMFDDAKSTTPFEKWLEARAKEKMGEHGTKMGLFITTLFSYLPYMMFCCIPLFAFVLKVLYIRRRIFYIDHLIYALHIHTFFYTGLMLIVLITIGLNRVIPGTFAGWVIALLWITFVTQIFLSIRYVYRQGWFISTLKFFIGGFVYMMVLFLALAATFFVTLAIP